MQFQHQPSTGACAPPRWGPICSAAVSRPRGWDCLDGRRSCCSISRGVPESMDRYPGRGICCRFAVDRPRPTHRAVGTTGRRSLGRPVYPGCRRTGSRLPGAGRLTGRRVTPAGGYRRLGPSGCHPAVGSRRVDRWERAIRRRPSRRAAALVVNAGRVARTARRAGGCAGPAAEASAGRLASARPPPPHVSARPGRRLCAGRPGVALALISTRVLICSVLICSGPVLKL